MRPVRVQHRLTAAVSVLIAAAVCTVTPSLADTGGGRLYFVDRSDLYTATAAHPGRHTRLPLPKVEGARHTYLEKAVPSPDGRLLAEVIQTGARHHWVFVAGPRGGHARKAFRIADPAPGIHSYMWSLQGLSWAGNRRLYFSATRYDASQPATAEVPSSLRTVHVSRAGVPGTVHTVPGTDGLMTPTTDPNGHSLAAVRVDTLQCTTGNQDTATSTIVVRNLRTRHQHDLVTVTSKRGHCPQPITGLAWSPDGTQLAFVPWVTTHKKLIVSQIDAARLDGGDGQTPRIAVRSDGRHLMQGPAWQSAHRLWFTRVLKYVESAERPGKHPDLFSVGYRSRRFAGLRREAHTTSVAEQVPSFG